MQDLNKQSIRFLNRKHVKVLLVNHTLTCNQIKRLNIFFSKFTCKETEEMHRTICFFILNDLNNYIGRYIRLKNIRGTTKYSQFLRYGRNGIAKYSLQSKSKVKHFKNLTDYWMQEGFSYPSAA